MDNGIINVEQMINKRADRMRSVMRDQGMGVLLTFNPETITYLTGVEVPDRFRDTESFFVVFPQSGELSLYALTTDFIASKYPWVRGYINQSVSINSIFADNHSLEFIIDRIVETIYCACLRRESETSRTSSCQCQRMCQPREDDQVQRRSAVHKYIRGGCRKGL